MGQIFLVGGEEVGAQRQALEWLFVGCSGGGTGGHKAQAQRLWADRRCGACRGGPSYCTGREHQPGRWPEQGGEGEEWSPGVLWVLGPLSLEVEEEPLCTSCLSLGHT